MWLFSLDSFSRCMLSFHLRSGGHTVGKRFALIAALLLGSFIVSGWSAAEAQSCPSCVFSGCHTPAVSPPPGFWGELEPSDTGVLPTNRDTTNVDGNVNPSLVRAGSPSRRSATAAATGSSPQPATTCRPGAWRIPTHPCDVASLSLAALGIRALVDWTHASASSPPCARLPATRISSRSAARLARGCPSCGLRTRATRN